MLIGREKEQAILQRALRSQESEMVAVIETRKQVFLSLISTYGLVENEQSIGLIDNTITLDALFY